MRQAWNRLCARFDALARRERIMVFFGALAAVALVGYQLLVDPYLARQATAMKSLAQARQSHKEILAKLATDLAPSRQPDHQARIDLENARARLAKANSRFEAVHATLVPPGRMAALVESVLRGERGLQMVAMTTLPPTPVTTKPEAALEAKPAPGAQEATGLYKHGLQVTVRGGYAELLRYLERLEKLPQKMYWGRVVLATEEHPASRLQLTVYTISFGRRWLEI